MMISDAQLGFMKALVKAAEPAGDPGRGSARSVSELHEGGFLPRRVKPHEAHQLAHGLITRGLVFHGTHSSPVTYQLSDEGEAELGKLVPAETWRVHGSRESRRKALARMVSGVVRLDQPSSEVLVEEAWTHLSQVRDFNTVTHVTSRLGVILRGDHWWRIDARPGVEKLERWAVRPR